MPAGAVVFGAAGVVAGAAPFGVVAGAVLFGAAPGTGVVAGAGIVTGGAAFLAGFEES